MKSMKQLFRQPVKSISGILLVTLAVAILITCVGQYAATELTRQDIAHNYNTVAVPTVKYRLDKYGFDTGVLSVEVQTWIDNAVRENSQLIKAVSDTGFLSAYIPGLIPDNPTQYDYTGGAIFDPFFNEPNCCAILEVTLTEIGTEYTWNGNGTIINDSPEGLQSVTLVCRATVDQVIVLQEGYRDPAKGMTAVLNIIAADEKALGALNLRVGQRYLVYTSDYKDLDHYFRSTVCLGQQNFLQFSEENIFEFAPKDSPILAESGPDGIQHWFYQNQITFNDETRNEYVTFHPDYLEYLNACQLTICDLSALPVLEPVFDREGWNVVNWNRNKSVQIYYQPGIAYKETYPYEWLQEPIIDTETFAKYYATPTIAPLTGTTEEFLVTEEGAIWRQALEEADINNHAFPVLTVDRAGYLGDFAREQIKITQGRDFTQEETDAGDRVCILSETVAALNGFELGDSVTLHSYGYDANVTGQRDMLFPSQIRTLKSSNPGAAFYSRYLGLNEPETYTIVGLYRHENPWNETSDYGITPNTILIPKSATAQTTVSQERAGIYRSYVLQNGTAEEFRKLTEDAGYPGLFSYYDQGYSQIKSGLDAYTGVSSRALYVGVGAWFVILVLFILLFPLRQREVLATMRSLGADRMDRLRHMLISTLGLLIPGTIFGWAVGTALWEALSAELMDAVGVTVPLVSNGTGMLIASVSQFLIAVAMVSITAMAMTREKGGRQ